MGVVASYLQEQRQAKTADQVINITLRQLKERTRILDEMSPVKMRDNRQWLAYITEQIDPIASLVSPGAEFPAIKKGQFSRIDTRLFKAALKHEWTEDIQWRLKEVKEFAAATGIAVQNMSVGEGKVLVGADNSLAELIFGTLQSLVRGHFNLIDYLAWQVWQTGAMQHTDFRTGLNINLDWKPVLAKSVSYNHFPAPVYEDAAGRDWTQLETADGIQDLVDMHYIYKYDAGVPADKIVMAEELVNLLLRQKSTKEAVVQSMTVGYQITGTPSLDQLNEVMGRRFLPPIVTDESQFSLDGDNQGINVPRRFLDPTMVVFMKKGVVERAFGGTLENNGKAGIFQRTYEKSKTPILDISETASNMVIIAPEIARYGMARKVTTKTNLDATMNLADFAKA